MRIEEAVGWPLSCGADAWFARAPEGPRGNAGPATARQADGRGNCTRCLRQNRAMTIHLRSTLAAAALALPLVAAAGPATDALGRCLTDQTSGKDRKELARWVFVAMSAHPEIKELSNVSPEARARADQSMGALVTQLLSDRCAKQTKQAVASEGPASLQGAFEVLGKVAMQELMTNQQVQASFSAFEKSVDKKKLDAFLKSK